MARGASVPVSIKAPVEELYKRVDGIYITLLTLASAFTLGVGLAQQASSQDALLLLGITMGSSLGALNYIFRETDYQRSASYASLGFVPAFGRTALSMPVLTGSALASLALGGIDITALAGALGAQVLVAVSEETFRAAMINLGKVLLPKRWELLRYPIANAAWVGYHFFRNPFSWPYFAWLCLFCAPCFTYVMERAGLGASCLAHMIVNLTA